jgi:hypothetical protein
MASSTLSVLLPNKMIAKPVPLEITEQVCYCPDTGVFTSRLTGKQYTARMKRDGRLFIFYKGKQYLANRIAWFIMTGENPDLMVDHIDGDCTNDKWCNLQLLTNQQNQHKSKTVQGNPKTINGEYTPYGRASRRKQGLQQ